MKTWMKLALMSLVSVALVACGGGGLQKISLPEALQTTDTVWMDVHHGESVVLDQYNTVTAVYHFDGKGNVLAYTGLDLNLGDLGGKNKKQILEIAKKQIKRNY